MWLKMKLGQKMLIKKSSEKLIHFQFDHCQCFHKTLNKNCRTIKVIMNKKMITHLCFINQITTQISLCKSSFDTIILILFFSSELYMLLSAQENADLLKYVNNIVKIQRFHYKTLSQSFLKFFTFQINTIFAKQVLTLFRIKVFFPHYHPNCDNF